MVYGLLVWGERGAVERTEILSAPFLKVTLPRGRGDVVSRLRVRRGAKLLRKNGVTAVVLPPEFPYREVLEKEGVFPVSTLALRREIASDWVAWALRKQGMTLSEAKVAVEAEVLTAEVVRTVTELSLRHRYVWLSVPRGGEVLSRRLRREYGVSLQLLPGKDAEAAIQFGKGVGEGTVVTLRLWDEAQPLPPLALPPNQEQSLPEGADRTQLIAALRAAGAVKQVDVER